MKSDYRKTCLLFLCGGLLLLLLGLLVPVFMSNSKDIIGGADTPTYEFLLRRTWHGFWYMLSSIGVALLITGVVSLVFEKAVKACCTTKTSLLALGISAGGSAGLYCWVVWWSIAAFGELSSAPLAYPFSIAGGFVCLLVCLCLLIIYIKNRKIQFTVRGLLLDVALVVIFFWPLFWIWQCLHGVFSDLIKVIGV